MGKWADAARKKAVQIHAAGGMLTDQQAFLVPAIFMPWSETGIYTQGDRVTFGGLLYRCLQGHAAQPDWSPNVAVSLWVGIDDPTEAWPEWRQPAGGHDAYALGAQVTHDGKRWKSTAANNVWEPGVYGWEQV